MPRRFQRSERKTRMWITMAGTVRIATPTAVPANNGALALVGSSNSFSTGADEIATFLNGGFVANPYLGAGSNSIFGTREWTLAALHMSAMFVGDSGSANKDVVGFMGVGVQGGGTAGVNDLPKLGENQNTGQWPLVVPIEPCGGLTGSVIYRAVGSSKSMRKVKLGQSIYLSAYAPTTQTAAFSIRAVVRCLALL